MTANILRKEWQARAHRDAASALLSAWIDQLGNREVPLKDWKFTDSQLEKVWARMDERCATLREVRHTVEFNKQAPDDYKRMQNSWFTYFDLRRALEKADTRKSA